MEMLIEIICTIFVLCLIYISGKYISHLWSIRNYPPGPFPLPIVGNIHSIFNQTLHLWAIEKAKTYGSVFSVSFGMERVVFINTINPTLDTLIKKSKSFSGRPTTHYFNELFSRGFNDIGLSDYGETWKNRRKLGHTALSMLNDDSGNTESKIVKESEELFLRLKEKVGKPVDVKKELGTCIINIMLNVLFNIRYDSDDKELFDIISMNEKVTTSSSLTDPIGWMKWLRHIYHSKNYIQLLDALAQRDKFLSKHLKEHLQTYQEGVQRDFTDFLIKYSSNSKLGPVASHSDLEMILMDMIFAGTETTLTALEWMVVYLIHWPEYQDKLFNDILENTEKGRYPGLRDRYKLHFVQAFIHEALRFSSFVPLNVPHKTLADEKFDFYSIPKGTTVFYNFWAIHHDEKEFQEPDTFNPHRWIDDDGNFRNSKSFILFSVGKRACLGENLARSELFLFLTRLVRDFKILAEPNVPLPELDGVIGTILVPVPFKATFHSRE